MIKRLVFAILVGSICISIICFYLWPKPQGDFTAYRYEKDGHSLEEITSDQLAQGLIQIIYRGRDFQGIPKWVQIDSAPYIEYSDAYEKRHKLKPFSCIWLGYLQIDKSAEYLIGIDSDDGSRLWIDKELVIDNWGEHASRTVENTVYLEKGLHRFELRYFDKGVRARLKLYWNPKRDFPITTFIPKRHFRYYKPDVAIIKPSELGNLAKIFPRLFKEDEILITDKLLIPEEGDYTFRAKSNNPAGIHIRRKNLLFKPGEEEGKTVNLRKKRYPLVISVENISGSPELDFHWGKG